MLAGACKSRDNMDQVAVRAAAHAHTEVRPEVFDVRYMGDDKAQIVK